jgi:hypothetical protein
MSKTFERFIIEVDEQLSDLTGGTFDLMVLTDFSDGENAMDEMFFEGLTPRQAAVRKMFADGCEGALNCWSTDCDFCEFLEDGCPHVC